MFTVHMNRLVLKHYKESIDSSSATIRNDITAKLRKMYIFEKAYTSSGRTPSRAGFQYSVS